MTHAGLEAPRVGTIHDVTSLHHLIDIMMFDCMIIEYQWDITLNMSFLFIVFLFS
jgi:hypothetical protein